MQVIYCFPSISLPPLHLPPLSSLVSPSPLSLFSPSISLLSLSVSSLSPYLPPLPSPLPLSCRVTTIQSPLSTFDVSHYWQCVYGPHPRLIILAEHTGVSLINFINDTPSYKMLINKVSLIISGCGYY